MPLPREMTREETEKLLSICNERFLDSGSDLICKEQYSRWVEPGKAAGHITAAGYRAVAINRSIYLVHRILYLMRHNDWPIGEIDHINGDRLDNRDSNLRVVSSAGNKRNRAINRNNTSGVTGVHWYSRGSKWHAQITVNRKCHHLGYFHSLDAAISVRKAAEKKFGFHPNHGRGGK